MTLFAGEPPHGVSEHTARTAPVLARASSAALATAWSHRSCVGREALLVLCPEHVKTIHRDGWSKEDLRQFLFAHTGVPLRTYSAGDGGEGTQQASGYAEILVDGEPCYRKFSAPSSIHIVVAGGTAGSFLSAVIGGWGLRRPARQPDGDVSDPRGLQRLRATEDCPLNPAESPSLCGAFLLPSRCACRR